MRTVLCIVHESDDRLEVLSRAVDDVRDGGGRLVVAAVHDPEYERSLNRQLTCRSFVGHKLSEEVSKIACHSSQERSRELLERACSSVRVSGVDVVSEYRTGALLESVQRLVGEFDPARAFVPRVQRSFWRRIFGGGVSANLQRSLRCPVVVVD